MVEDVKILKLLSSRTRLDIAKLLEKKERCVCEIFPRVEKTQSTVSIHLGKMENAGLLESRRDGKKVFYKIADNRVYKILNALEAKK